METLHHSRLTNVAHVSSDLRSAAESLSVEQKDDGGIELTADCRVHLWTDQHHPLQHAERRNVSHLLAVRNALVSLLLASVRTLVKENISLMLAWR